MSQRTCFCVRSAEKPSTRLSHEEEVGVKCTWKRGRLVSQRRTSASCGGRSCPGSSSSAGTFCPIVFRKKLQSTAPTVGLADHSPGVRIRDCEKARGAVALVVVRASLRLARTHPRQRLLHKDRLPKVETVDLHFLTSQAPLDESWSAAQSHDPDQGPLSPKCQRRSSSPAPRGPHHRRTTPDALVRLSSKPGSSRPRSVRTM